MSKDNISRVTVLAVGVEDYTHLSSLRGPRQDVENFYNLLVVDDAASLYQEGQVIKKINPTSDDLRAIISHYTSERTALGDVLVFYFSGHGVPVGHQDFGFCTVDTQILAGQNVALPLTMFRFSELLVALSVVDVTPVIIIDACYSGRAVDAIIPSSTIITSMHEKMKNSNASNYALLCSCSEFQTSINIPHVGGMFSTGLVEIGKRGDPNLSDDVIGLVEIFGPLRRFVEANADDSSPRLYLGETLINIPLFRNVSFSGKRLIAEQSYSFVGHLKSIVLALWNEGYPRALRPGEILEVCGRGAYGNHSKLSFAPWQLVETCPESKKRRLTEKGLLFVQGSVKIPKTIKTDAVRGIWIPSPGSPEISIDDL
jgi:hypothetical protein